MLRELRKKIKTAFNRRYVYSKVYKDYLKYKEDRDIVGKDIADCVKMYETKTDQYIKDSTDPLFSYLYPVTRRYERINDDNIYELLEYIVEQERTPYYEQVQKMLQDPECEKKIEKSDHITKKIEEAKKGKIQDEIREGRYDWVVIAYFLSSPGSRLRETLDYYIEHNTKKGPKYERYHIDARFRFAGVKYIIPKEVLPLINEKKLELTSMGLLKDGTNSNN